MGTGAIANALTTTLVMELVGPSELLGRIITVATRSKSSVVGLVKNLSITFKTLLANLDFLVVDL